jgi:hypothetical protein
VLNGVSTSPRGQSSLEAQFESELEIAWVQSAARLAKVGGNIKSVVGGLGVRLVWLRQYKICMVEHVEAFGSKLHTDSLGNLEILEERHVCIPTARTYKGVAAEVSGAAQARGAENASPLRPGRSPPVRPHIVSSAAVPFKSGIWP